MSPETASEPAKPAVAKANAFVCYCDPHTVLTQPELIDHLAVDHGVDARAEFPIVRCRRRNIYRRHTHFINEWTFAGEHVVTQFLTVPN